MALPEPVRRLLLDTAWRSIRGGIESRIRHLPADPHAPSTVLEQGACFVTLSQQGALRGCCGTVRPHRPLLEDVADNAWRTAFDDPRFPPLEADEFDGLMLEISVLSPMKRVAADDERELMRQVQPGVHGLMIAEGRRRATFLPKVWDSLGDPALFLDQLKQKAGLTQDEWPEGIRAWVYTTEIFGELNS